MVRVNEQETVRADDIPAEASIGKGSVLVVDDDVAVADLLRRWLRRAGFEVTVADDGGAACETLAGRSFDAIVSDIQMPGLDGLQLLRGVREWDLDVPVIMMTGAPSVDTAMHALEYGAFRYVAKPFDPKELVSVVNSAVRLKRLAQTKRQALELLGADTKLVGDRAGLDMALDRALESLWMAYQPIVSPLEQKTFGYEALLRSREPVLPHPGAVLEAAERLDRVHDVGRAVRGRVADTISQTHGPSTFFVNLHARDLLDESLLSPSSPLSRVASRVVLEITERASLDGVSDVRSRIKALRDLGFRLAVDDLGAGYAGLSSFANIEPEVVKIDMSLVRGVDSSAVKRQIVEKLSALARELGIIVVAEGVESASERDALRSIGCDLLQGYLFAKPAFPFPDVSW
jgi:EAL domain-containing protein (putative c-di-GMP-specific phosphodiesterase class I)/CheY-like chemotaxis protein